MIPIGSKVRIIGGAYINEYGVVTQQKEFPMNDHYSVTLLNHGTNKSRVWYGKNPIYSSEAKFMTSEQNLEVVSEEEFSTASVIEG
jgi:hypothetical protein